MVALTIWSGRMHAARDDVPDANAGVQFDSMLIEARKLTGLVGCSLRW